MRIRVFHKVLLATSLSSLLLIGLVALFFYDSVSRGFAHYANGIELNKIGHVAGHLEQAYRHYRSWDFLRDDPGQWQRMLRPDPPGAQTRPEPDEPVRPPPPPSQLMALGPRVTLYDLNGEPVMGYGLYHQELRFRPVQVDGRTVGWLAVRSSPRLHGDVDEVFLDELGVSLFTISAIALLLAVLVAALLARHILAPVRTLEGAVRRLTAGDYAGHASSTRRDELGQLSRDFNLLARTLALTERSRRRWVADSSHELRTPLASLRAEIEAAQDGVMPLDDALLASLHDEVSRLSRLVDDLHQLSQSDAGDLQYRHERCDPVELVEQAVAGMAHRFDEQGLTLETDCGKPGAAWVLGDPNRLVQLFKNLLENSARYTDPDGRVEVHCLHHRGWFTLRIEDSAPGIPKDAYGRVFERLYRVDRSRARAADDVQVGSGLGLAICRQIAEAHRGSIRATASPLGGVSMTVTLPLD